MAAFEAPESGKLFELVEMNLGSWKPSYVAIIDVNQKIWDQKGKIRSKLLRYYKKFPLSEMHIGDSVHNENTFLMKVSEKTGVIVEMNNTHIARLAAMNLRGKLNALTEFSKLENFIQERENKTRVNGAAKTEKDMW